SSGGLRVAHRSQLPNQEGLCQVEVPSSNGGGTIQLDCAIVHTSMRHANAAAEALFHSGLRIMTPNPPLDAILKKGQGKV
ncbi:MAG TPA: hypothetical protein VLU46_08755, partial [Thermoanaerobaculia bacterium]|nr:hypothetical protein [Thermoanaerobaculia bacterium]